MGTDQKAEAEQGAVRYDKRHRPVALRAVVWNSPELESG
jgi:hypothetical protein